MKIILREDISKLGKFGETLEVSEGYARNYLLPKELAWPYEEKYFVQVENLRKKMAGEQARIKTQAEELAAKINQASVTIEVEAGEEEKLFGSVTSIDIADKLAEAGIKIDKKIIEISEPIKKLGVYKISVKLHPEVEAVCKVWVVKK